MCELTADEHALSFVPWAPDNREDLRRPNLHHNDQTRLGLGVNTLQSLSVGLCALAIKLQISALRWLSSVITQETAGPHKQG